MFYTVVPKTSFYPHPKKKLFYQVSRFDLHGVGKVVLIQFNGRRKEKNSVSNEGTWRVTFLNASMFKTPSFVRYDRTNVRFSRENCKNRLYPGFSGKSRVLYRFCEIVIFLVLTFLCHRGFGLKPPPAAF